MSSILTQKYCDIDKFQKLKNLKNHWCGCQKVFLQIISVSKFGSAAEWRARQGFVKSINTTWTFWTTRVVVVVVLTTGINVIHRRVQSIVIFSDRLPGVVATKTRRKEMFSLSDFPSSLPFPPLSLSLTGFQSLETGFDDSSEPSEARRASSTLAGH